MILAGYSSLLYPIIYYPCHTIVIIKGNVLVRGKKNFLPLADLGHPIIMTAQIYFFFLKKPNSSCDTCDRCPATVATAPRPSPIAATPPWPLPIARHGRPSFSLYLPTHVADAAAATPRLARSSPPMPRMPPPRPPRPPSRRRLSLF